MTPGAELWDRGMWLIPESSVALADALGVDRQALREALQGSALNAPVALAKLAKIDAGDETPDFSLRWATKDVGLGRRFSPALAFAGRLLRWVVSGSRRGIP